MTKIALILSGGASLGSYVGGAVTEILAALEEGSGGDRPRVGVITGSSAGALNAALAARTLLVNPNVRPWIERAWVDAADDRTLLRPERPDRRGFLDVSAVEELMEAMVTAEPAADDRVSDAVASPLRVGVTLSNLDGIPYDFRYGFLNVADRFYGTRIYRDWVELELDATAGAEDPRWTELREAAVASASFPLAFPPRRLRRDPDDYPGARLESGDGRLPMWYADGGLFENEPLGLAKRLVERDPDHRRDEWKYVLVDPYMEEDGVERRGETADIASTAELAERLTRAVLGQGAARDWIRANRVNARLEILEDLVTNIPEFAGRLDDPDAVGLGREIGRLAERVAEMKVAVRRGGDGDGGGDPVVDYLEQNLERIQSDPRYERAFRDADTRAGRSRIAKTIFILESAAGLRDKDPMDLYLVAPPRGERLAGAFLGNFGGFFHRDWRSNDFRAGRRDARRLLTGSLADVVDYSPAPDEAYAVEDLRPGFADVPARGKQRLERFLEAEVERALDDLRPGGMASLFSWAWKPMVRRFAVKRLMERLRTLG